MSIEKPFVSSLEQVARRFGVSRATVIEWRDQDQCPYLVARPYNCELIGMWIIQQAGVDIDPGSALARRKLELEIERIEDAGAVFSKDKTFWVAVAVLGIQLIGEVREWIADVCEWIDGKNEGLQQRMTLPKGHRFPMVLLVDHNYVKFNLAPELQEVVSVTVTLSTTLRDVVKHYVRSLIGEGVPPKNLRYPLFVARLCEENHNSVVDAYAESESLDWIISQKIPVFGVTRDSGIEHWLGTQRGIKTMLLDGKSTPGKLHDIVLELVYLSEMKSFAARSST